MQCDCALRSGLDEHLRTLDMPRDVVPHGGHPRSLNVAAGLAPGGNQSCPDVFAPFGGFADATPVQHGHVAVPDLPGVGFQAKAALIAALRRVPKP